MLETATPLAPALKNSTSSRNSGVSAGNQFPLDDQLFAPAPGPFQTIVVAGWLETVSVKLSLAVRPLESVTVTVMMVMPVWFASGVTVTVWFVPLPPKTMFAAGTRPGLDEASLTVSVTFEEPPIVNEIGPVVVFGAIVRSAMVEIVGPAPGCEITSCGWAAVLEFSREA